MNKKSEILLYSISITLALIVITCIFFKINLSAVSSEDNAVQVKIEIPESTTVKAAGEILYENNLIRNRDLFYIAARYPFITKLFFGNAQSLNLKSGVYRISSSMSVPEIFEVLSSGKQDYIVISIPEGLTISKIGKKLEEEGVCSKEEFVKKAHDKELLSKYNIFSPSLEGYLFPDTYYFTPDMKAEQVINLMYENFRKNVSKIPELQGLTPEELDYKVKLASIIEREYRVKEEAPLIASVFTNRLKINMGLYSCATVEYIITEIENKPHPEKITYADLDNPSPYNTYKWAGLPPGAISNPGLVSLKAAAKPANTNYYYFVLKSDQSGRHNFSRDFQTHVNKGYEVRTK